ncbi:MAG: double zinc ribbon domain-containing protein [Gemmatimonadales bacterium]|nr:double zinc ribbon domain-containing protein [Gemmatimonadales bacterium]
MRPWCAALPERIGAVERWLLPPACLLCGEAAGGRGDDPLVCPMCRTRWRRLPEPQCPRCGQPVDGETDCRICEGWPEGFSGVASAVWLDGPARRAVHALKYDGWRRMAESLAVVMDDLRPLRAGVSLVPIPLGAARRRSRGYNQSEAVAGAVGRRRGLPVEACLVRTRETRSQTSLTPEERAANLKAAFSARGRVPARVVLVDDVFTTGATLRSAAAALLAAGAVSVAAVTFGRAELPLAALGRTI